MLKDNIRDVKDFQPAFAQKSRLSRGISRTLKVVGLPLIGLAAAGKTIIDASMLGFQTVITDRDIETRLKTVTKSSGTGANTNARTYRLEIAQMAQTNKVVDDSSAKLDSTKHQNPHIGVR